MVKSHEDDIRNKLDSNALGKHLEIFNKDHVGEADTFSFIFHHHQDLQKGSLETICKGSLDENSDADIVLNGKSEFNQPSIPPESALTEGEERMLTSIQDHKIGLQEGGCWEAETMFVSR